MLSEEPPPRWGKVLDQSRCIGCHACTTACKSENQVPIGVTRTYVKYVDTGVFPTSRRAFQVTRCNQCQDAPCVTACPTAAMHRRPDGIVDFDKRVCIGCKACIAACPYDAIFINPDDGAAEKCNLCAHRLDQGLEPACVVVCPTNAILVGDLDDPTSRVAQVVNRQPVQVRRPEKGTRPTVFYKGATQATLDPLAARRPSGGIFMWSEQGDTAHGVRPGAPGRANNSAAAVLAYDVIHRAPWDWRVGLYTWTKSIAAGAYLVALLLTTIGAASPGGPLWAWVAPLLAGVALALTGLILIWDLEHPERFYLLFTRPQWRSWLVRGGIVISAYGGVLAVHVLSSLLAAPTIREWLAVLGAPAAIATAVYTAYLFAQARARDLWQSPLLPPHLLVQAGLAGSAALLPFALWLEPSAAHGLAVVLAVSAAAHLLLSAGEVTIGHPTAHARLAVHELVGGAHARVFWAGAGLVLVAVAAPWIGVWAVPCALAGQLLHDHAYVQAGQSVPLA